VSDLAKPGVVYDTGCVLQAAINPAGPAAEALDLLDRGIVTAYVSPRLRSEYEDVLARPSIRQKNPLVTDRQVEAGLARFDALAVMVPNAPQYVAYSRYPDDEPVINLAIHVHAGYIVSRDRDLLDLMDDDNPDGRYFTRHFPWLSILAPVAFLRAIRIRAG
jgi:putative PIN family toxin of toxin-antitoxin system